jgi:hypothetical protein
VKDHPEQLNAGNELPYADYQYLSWQEGIELTTKTPFTGTVPT